MFALIKLTAYALLGYFVYEFYIGLTGSEPPTKSRARSQGGARTSSQREREPSGQH
jgi:hypothetical protein